MHLLSKFVIFHCHVSFHGVAQGTIQSWEREHHLQNCLGEREQSSLIFQIANLKATQKCIWGFAKIPSWFWYDRTPCASPLSINNRQIPWRTFFIAFTSIRPPRSHWKCCYSWKWRTSHLALVPLLCATFLSAAEVIRHELPFSFPTVFAEAHILESANRQCEFQTLTWSYSLFLAQVSLWPIFWIEQKNLCHSLSLSVPILELRRFGSFQRLCQ